MRILSLLCLLSLSMSGVSAETLVIAGTGDNQNLLRLLATAFEKEHSGVTVEVPDSIGSKGGIKAVAAGRVRLGRSARRVKPTEAKGLVEYHFAIAPIVFVAHPSAEGVTNIMSTQVVDIYAGRISNWNQLNGPRHRLYAVDREKGDSSRSVLEKKLPGFAGLESKAKRFFSTPDAVAALNQHQYTFGYLPMSEVVRTGMKALTVDGIQASAENITAGRYPYVTGFYLISKGEATGPAKDFIDFVGSEPAKKIIRDFGVVPVEDRDG